MRLLAAIPATALVVAASTFAWMRAPQAQGPSPKRLVARAGLGALSAIAGGAERKPALEQTRAADPLTLSSSRPDSVAPLGGTPVELVDNDLARYHERALAKARASSRVVVPDPTGDGARAAAVAEFEKKCAGDAKPTGTKPRCSTSALGDVPPVLGCYLQQAASALLS